MAFQTPIDIMNVALQNVGAPRIVSFADNTKAAQEAAFAYDKVRRAELRRNTWACATRRAILRALDTTTMLLAPPVWNATTTYPNGYIVNYGGTLWQSSIAGNLNSAPVSLQIPSPFWVPYFGPVTVSPWLSGTSSTANTGGYGAGELVYVAPGDGTFNVFMSLENGNTDDPLAYDAWSATDTYQQGQIVGWGSPAALYASAVNLNQGNQPDIVLAATGWNATTIYAQGAYAADTNGLIYKSLADANEGNEPSTSGLWWASTGMWANTWSTALGPPYPVATSQNWLWLSGMGLAPLTIQYPLTSGPATDPRTRNAFMLPAGFLREAPNDPKPGIPWLGGPLGKPQDDWVIENGFLVSSDLGPLMFRFVADVQDVSQFDDMFCIGLGLRGGIELAETLTQSPQKKLQLTQDYMRFMSEARTVGSIEAGWVQPPLDDWIAVRS